MRKKELDTDFLQYVGLIVRWVVRTTELNRADVELLMYLNPFPAFTIHDWTTGVILYSWDKGRFYRLQKQEWITKIHDGRGFHGGHSKYVVSAKGKRLVNRIGRLLDGREQLPESIQSNKIMKGDAFIDKMYKQSIKAFNKR